MNVKRIEEFLIWVSGQGHQKLQKFCNGRKDATNMNKSEKICERGQAFNPKSRRKHLKSTSFSSSLSRSPSPKGMVFESCWSENGKRFWPLWSEIGYGFQGNHNIHTYIYIHILFYLVSYTWYINIVPNKYHIIKRVYKRICLFNPKWIREKEK